VNHAADRLGSSQVIPEEDGESAHGGISRPATALRLRAMKRRFWIFIIAFALLVLALLGWTVEAMRWATTGSRQRRPLVSPA
jgi:hypothetical protein